MIELAFAFGAGLLGSAHCLGMCGGFAVSLGVQAASTRSNLAKQGAFTLGKASTYGSMGALAGYLGMQFEGWNSPLDRSLSILALVAGAFLMGQGLISAGVLRAPQVQRIPVACLIAPIFRSLQSGSRVLDGFLLGVLTGFLPCGLLYGMLASAATTQHFLLGGLTMISFGLGTAPALIAAGLGAGRLQIAWRKRFYQLAGWCLVMTGLITMSRGIHVHDFSLRTDAASCPFCEQP